MSLICFPCVHYWNVCLLNKRILNLVKEFSGGDNSQKPPASVNVSSVGQCFVGRLLAGILVLDVVGAVCVVLFALQLRADGHIGIHVQGMRISKRRVEFARPYCLQTRQYDDGPEQHIPGQKSTKVFHWITHATHPKRKNANATPPVGFRNAMKIWNSIKL